MSDIFCKSWAFLAMSQNLTTYDRLSDHIRPFELTVTKSRSVEIPKQRKGSYIQFSSSYVAL